MENISKRIILIKREIDRNTALLTEYILYKVFMENTVNILGIDSLFLKMKIYVGNFYLLSYI